MSGAEQAPSEKMAITTKHQQVWGFFAAKMLRNEFKIRQYHKQKVT